MIPATDATWNSLNTATMLALTESKPIHFVELASGEYGPRLGRTVWQLLLGSDGKIYRVTTVFEGTAVVGQQFWEVYEA